MPLLYDFSTQSYYGTVKQVSNAFSTGGFYLIHNANPPVTSW